jgi:hypothetical protein
MATDIGSGRDARTTRGAVIAAGGNGTPRQSRAVKRHHRMVMLIIGVNLLRDRRVREQVFLGAITLAALALLARQSQARARARLIAWLDTEPGPARAGPTAAQLTSRSGLPGRAGPHAGADDQVRQRGDCRRRRLRAGRDLLVDGERDLVRVSAPCYRAGERALRAFLFPGPGVPCRAGQLTRACGSCP